MNRGIIMVKGGEPVGGKARALFELQHAGFHIPKFFVALPGTPEADIRQTSKVWFSEADALAVRSSAVGEDSGDHSFAGQFSSYLYVKLEDVPARCRDVWASGDSERVAAYREERGAEFSPPAAIVQEMIDPDCAGVAFSADPVSGRRGIAVVSAVVGVGERLVSGESDADTFRVNVEGEIVSTELAGTSPCLPQGIVREIANLARDCATHFGRPQDIEWALKENELWLLQSRPITSLGNRPDPDAPRRIWDNSNIAESYSGVTTPLTYTFARRAYENVYRQFCLIMGVPAHRMAANEAIFPAMIGLVRGRIYYNLISWYRLLSLLPGFRANRPFMEQMMGVKEPMPEEVVREIESDGATTPAQDRRDLRRTVRGLLRQWAALPRSIEQFYARLNTALQPPQAGWTADQWVRHYRDLEKQLLTRWDAPLVNDFLAMIFSGVLRKLSAKWCGDISGGLANDLLADIGDIVSLEPARRIRQMAEKQARGEAIRADLAAYLEKFGDRCVEELKLESPTLRDDATSLTTSIAALATRIKADESPEPEKRSAPPIPPLPGPKSAIFRWVLSQARARVRDRENLRFERTRVFGRVRQIMRALGASLAETGAIEKADDVFYLELEEILGHFEGTGAIKITPELVRLRRAEFERYRAETPPPDRFETFGPPSNYTVFEDLLAARYAEAEQQEGDLKGIGACAGRVRGKVRVVKDPRGVVLNPGEILVAQQTDPGWVVLFPAASGLLVERGSLLSHSAIVAREMGIPAIVSIPAVTRILHDGDEVEMDGATGVIRVIARG